MPHNIEEKGIELLIANLKLAGHKVERTFGTFDLMVDDSPAEVKTKNKQFDQLDFISLTDKQYQAMQNKDFDIYLVCNLETEKPEFYKINTNSLKAKTPRIIQSFEYDRSKFSTIAEKINQ